MVSVVGRGRDRTASIARAIGRMLEPGERVLAAVTLNSPGTNEAAMAGGASGGVAGALGAPVTFPPGQSRTHQTWLVESAAVGIDTALAARTVALHLAITSRRVILVRRSRLLARPRELLASWPLAQADVKVPRGGSHVDVWVGEHRVRLELPKAHKFLPDVYRQLPKIRQSALSELE